MDFMKEEICWSREPAFLNTARKFLATQWRNKVKVFAARKTALPSGSSLVASCKISEINPTQRTRRPIP
jgi:hypothetical protein